MLQPTVRILRTRGALPSPWRQGSRRAGPSSPRPRRAAPSLCLAALALALAATGCDGCDASEAGGAGRGEDEAASVAEAPRVVVLGFDGVDPDLVEAWMAEGDLPHLKRLSTEGTFARLRSTTPPQSPVAWATFASGRLPGGHGIYDFIARRPASYLPRVATVRVDRPVVRDGAVVRGLEGTNLRRGESFWHRAGRAGVPGTVLFVPYSFPPDGAGPMRVVSGLGTPDLRGTNSSFQYFARDRFPDGRPEGPVSGGRFSRATGDGPALSARIAGPSLDVDGTPRALEPPVSFAPRDEAVTVTGPGAAPVTVPRGRWSAPVSFAFEPVPGVTWRAVSRWYAAPDPDDPLAVFLSPLSADPRAPPFALSSPAGFAGELAEALGGPFETVGWIHETSGLSAGALDEAGFLADLMDTLALRERALLHVLAEGHDRLTVAAFTAPDRASHMLWRLTDPDHPGHDPALAARHGGAIRQTYRRMDAIVGRVLEALPPEALLLVVSDHGFHGFRRGVNLNRWLVDRGYMVLKEGADVGRDFFRDVDWSRTRAYALGTGQVWVNRAGREGRGIVPPEAAPALAAELAEGLRGLVDGDTPAVAEVHVREETYAGPAAGDAPDLTVSFAEGYRTGWGSILGGAPPALFEDNLNRWSGDHAASDPADTEGVLFSNRRLPVDAPGIEDVAPTVLGLYGVPFDGPGRAWAGAAP